MEKIRAALVIQNCPAGCFEQNLNRTLSSVSQAAGMGADIVVFPEMNLTGYAAGDISIARPVAPLWTDALGAAAAEHQVAVLTGLSQVTGEGRIFATHLIVFPDRGFSLYQKIHLSPFESSSFSPGSQVPVFDFKGVKIGIQLCYDAHFPDLSTAMAIKGADILFFPHASPRGSARDKFESWMRHLPARAFDNAVFVAAVNQAGDNGAGLNFPGLALAIGPDGYLISKDIKDQAGIHLVEMDTAALDRVRSHKMRYFLPNRKSGLIR